jgi:Leucine-rich repeat (LRR) protein
MPTPPPAPSRLLLAAPLLAILALAAVAANANAATPPSPADALLAWKSNLGDPAALSTWTNATQVSICTTWRGVACDAAGRVVSLRLRGLGLTGGLDELDPAAFPSLTSLDLKDNNLAGAIPASFSQLPALSTLDLGSNGLNGTIPPQLGDLYIRRAACRERLTEH